MKILSIPFFIILGFVSSGQSLSRVDAAETDTQTDWRIETEYKFQLGYYRANENQAHFRDGFGSEDAQTLVPLDLSGPGIPEMSIPVKMALDRGFSLPYEKNPSELTYFMKLFRYPSNLKVVVSAGTMASAFLLNATSHGKEFDSFIRSPENIIVKAGVIRPSKDTFEAHPFPTFSIPHASGTRGKATAGSQEYFDSGLFYSTIAIAPSKISSNGLSDDKGRIRASASGLQSFLREMIDLYSSSFSEIAPPIEDTANRFFVSREACIGKLPEECRLVVYRIPKEILVFNDARSKPRPIGPKGSFASGFAMIQRTEYYRPQSDFPSKVPTFREIRSKWRPGPARVLEAVSLVQF